MKAPQSITSQPLLIQDFISDNNLSLIGLLETRVQENVAKTISSGISPNFEWFFNYNHYGGGRIWLGWNSIFWDVNILSSSAQHITCSVTLLQCKVSLVISFVYGFNTEQARRSLWAELSALSPSLNGLPWVVCGDFNSCISTDEKQGGNISWTSEFGHD